MAIPLILRIYRGDALVATKEFHRDIIKIGRLSSAHVCLEDEKVSRIHAVVEVAGDGSVSIIDMSSVEGTYVNGKRVSKASLSSGDEITVGGTRLQLEIGAAEAAAGAPVAAAAAIAADLGAEANTMVGMAPSAEAIAAAGAAATGAADDEETAAAPAPAVAAPPPQAPAGAVAAAGPARPTPLPSGAGGGAMGLDVRLFWGDQQLAAGLYDTEETVTVGPSPLATLQVEDDGIPDDAFPLLRQSNGDWYLAFTASMDGELNRGGQISRLGDLVKSREAKPGEGGAYEVALTADSAAWVSLGNTRADVCFRTKPKAVFVPLAERLDYQFLNLLLVVFFLHAAAVVAFQNYTFDADILADDLFANQARFAKLILKPPEKKRNRFADRLQGLKDPGQSPEKAAMKEGKMGKKEAPKRNTRTAPKAIDINDKEVVKNKGLLAMLGKGKNSGLSTVFGTSGLGGDLRGAIGGIHGSAVGDAHGLGGLGLKGGGPGGGGVGNSIGIGDIGTKGRGSGNGGYGTGVGGLGRKGTADVSISSSEAVVMGSLDKELIRRVIHQHRSQIRYCYESELVRNPKLGGKIAVKFVIRADGRVQSAVTAQSTMNNRTVESCVNSRVKSWTFPKPRGGGIVMVTYPFVFKQSGG